MSTIIYPSPIFGPIHSRRLGVSLGINLLPSDGKLCSFDCIYCECGFNKEHKPLKPLPSIPELHEALELKLQEMKKSGIMPDVLTFAGNGEPTLHPQFLQAVNTVIKLRDTYCPQAKISVLSNATQIHKPSVREALLLVDNNILKLDTVNSEYINKVDSPCGHYNVEEIIEQMCAFEGKLIIQTLFMQGIVNNINYDNTTPEFVEPYLQTLLRINPQMVMIYTIDRETPTKGLEKATPVVLDAIAEKIKALGLKVSVSY